MKVVVLQMYGLGNAVMTTPMLRAIRSKGHEVDVVVEKGRAAHLVFEDWPEVIGHLYESETPSSITYDLAIFAHPIKPFGSRVYARRHVEPNIRRDPRGYMWGFDRHEVEVLCTLAREHCGFQGETPELRVPMPAHRPIVPERSVALGIGYLKTDPFWAKKHWGNERYAALAAELHKYGITAVLVGGPEDQDDAVAIERACPTVLNTVSRLPFRQVVGLISGCAMFYGNDSGLMHVAAAVNIPVTGMFTISNPTKNHPWCQRHVELLDPDVRTVVAHIRNVVDGFVASQA